MFPARSDLVIQFSHVAYQFEKQFAHRNMGIRSYSTWTPAETESKIGDADIIVATGYWQNTLLGKAKKLKLKTVGGIGMLINQAVPGFEHWFQKSPVIDDEIRKFIVE